MIKFKIGAKTRKQALILKRGKIKTLLFEFRLF